jgi:hydroxyacylglutathione hydrolase
MRVIPVPCLRDNYAYLVVCDDSNEAAVVDPSEAAPVLQAVDDAGVRLTAIWNTHHHWDHVGGNEELCAALPDLAVVAHDSDDGRVPGQTARVADGDVVTVGKLSATIIHNPGHTTGAISYHLPEQRAVFTGDTLFCAGCGRLFEGTPAQMHESLSRLAALPGDTDVYVGHEYTAANLRFAAAVEPDSEAIAARRRRTDELRAADRPTVPATIDDERATNPFLRVDEPAVAAAARVHVPDAATPAAVFAALRAWKDRF